MLDDLENWLAPRAATGQRLGAACPRPTSAAWSIWRRCVSRRRSPGSQSLPAAGLPWFMTMFGRDSILTSLQSLPFTPELARDHAARARRVAGHPGRRLPRRGSGPDPARDALRRDDARSRSDRTRRTTATPTRRRCSSCCSTSTSGGPVTTDLVREFEHEARAALQLDRRVRRPAGQRLHLVSAAQRGDRPGEPVLEGLLGLDRLRRRAAARISRARRASCRGTPTTRRSAALGWPGSSGTTRTTPTALLKQAADLKSRFNKDFWIADRQVFRARAGRRRRAGRLAVVQHRPPAVERHRRQDARPRRSSIT